MKMDNFSYNWHMDRIEAIRRRMPDCAITTDVIAGFCGETIEDHLQTLELFRKVGYDYAFMFKYSMRPNTYAHKYLKDDVAEEEKTRRLEEIIKLQGELSLESYRRDVGRRFEVLVEGTSKRNKAQLFGRNSQNKVIVFDGEGHSKGEYLTVEVTSCTSATLMGHIVK